MRVFAGCMLIGLTLFSGCAMVTDMTALVDAQREFEVARAANMQKSAPYEYTLGYEYLRKAREEAGYSDYKASELLARQAIVHFREAEQRAEKAKPSRAVEE